MVNLNRINVFCSNCNIVTGSHFYIDLFVLFVHLMTIDVVMPNKYFPFPIDYSIVKNDLIDYAIAAMNWSIVIYHMCNAFFKVTPRFKQYIIFNYFVQPQNKKNYDNFFHDHEMLTTKFQLKSFTLYFILTFFY